MVASLPRGGRTSAVSDHRSSLWEQQQNCGYMKMRVVIWLLGDLVSPRPVRGPTEVYRKCALAKSGPSNRAMHMATCQVTTRAVCVSSHPQ